MSGKTYLKYTILVSMFISSVSFADRGPVFTGKRSYESTRAVYISYRSSEGIYTKARRACGSFFGEISSQGISQARTSYSVEIINVIPKIKRASALCVAKKYQNDEVFAVSKL